MKEISDSLFLPGQFREACITLAESFRPSGTEARWTPTSKSSDPEISDKGYLLIRETFSCRNPAREIRTDYHVLLSQTWQVPVLYFSPVWSDTVEPLTLKEVYAFIVQVSSKEALEDVGVMGGISHGVCLFTFSSIDLRTILSSEHRLTSSIHVAQQTSCKTSKKKRKT